jgi:ribosomal protein S18 acetylase RimI-like enzyme
MLASPGLTVVVADNEGQVAASCTLAVIPTLSWRGSPFAVIENVGTRPEHRRKGIGHAVLAFAIQRAKEAGCYKVTLSTGSKQESTLHFYESAGFRRNAKTFFELSLEPRRQTS